MMAAPEPMVSPEDNDRDARPPLERVLESLSAANRKLLEFMRKAVRIELGEGGRPVMLVSADLSFEPLDVLWLVHFGVLTVHVDNADRVFLVKTDTTDLACGEPCKPKRKYTKRAK